MQIQIASRRLHISVLPLVCVVSLLAIMVKLGFWQLDRAQQKKILLKGISEGHSQAVETLYKVPDDFTQWQYRKVEIRGRYLPEKQFLLDNQFSGRQEEKRAGFNVLTPLQLQDGSVLLVNRGWLARQENKALLPNVSVGEEPGMVKGLIRLPARGFSLGQIASAGGWPMLIQYIDIDELAELSQLNLQEVILMLLPDEPAGYERNWRQKKSIKMGPAVHYGYAFQWFALSATLLALSLFIVIKKVKR